MRKITGLLCLLVFISACVHHGSARNTSIKPPVIKFSPRVVSTHDVGSLSMASTLVSPTPTASSSATISPTPTPSTTPSASPSPSPTPSPSPSCEGNTGETHATLEWDAVPEEGAVNYRVYWGTASREYSNHADVGTALSYQLSGLTCGSVYYLAVTAFWAVGDPLESDFSNEVSWGYPCVNGVVCNTTYSFDEETWSDIMTMTYKYKPGAGTASVQMQERPVSGPTGTWEDVSFTTLSTETDANGFTVAQISIELEHTENIVRLFRAKIE